jgi:hypothetical protein
VPVQKLHGTLITLETKYCFLKGYFAVSYGLLEGSPLKIVNQAGAAVFETLVEEALYEVNLSSWSDMGLYFLQLIDAGVMNPLPYSPIETFYTNEPYNSVKHL